ncbi:MAG: NADP-dependent oxidoreductase [Actinomycetales bacterium]
MTRALAIASREDTPAVQEVPTAGPGAGEVSVRVEAASVNGFDAAVAAGYVWGMIPHEFPVVLGRDFAGEVDSVGEGVTDRAVGERVAGVITGMTLDRGAIIESLSVPAGSLFTVPENLTSAQAAAVGLAGLTAVALVEALDLSASDSLLVSGATGGVGSLAVQLAAATGATVLATTRAEAADFVTDLGATIAIDYTDDLEAAVAKAVPGGLTAVVHAAGDAATLAGLLAPGGRLASALGATNEAVGRDDITVTGVMAAPAAEHLPRLLAQVADGTLVVPVAATYPFDQAAEALAAFGGHKLGKLVVTVA